MTAQNVRRSVFQKVFGICATPKAEPGSWRFAGGMLVIELSRAPDLTRPGGAIRVEKGRGLPMPVLVFRDVEGRWRAVENRCAHAGRKLDPAAEANELQCCSFGKSRFDLHGHVTGGMAGKDVRVLSVEERDGRLLVQV